MRLKMHVLFLSDNIDMVTSLWLWRRMVGEFGEVKGERTSKDGPLDVHCHGPQHRRLQSVQPEDTS